MTADSPYLLLLLLPVLAFTTWAWWGRRHGLGRRRRIVSLALRLLIFTSLVLSLAGLTWLRPRSAQAVVFVGDLSASAQAGQGEIVRFIDQAVRTRGRDDRAAVVALGREARVEGPPAPLSAFTGFNSVIDPGYTNLEAGLGLGGAILPAGYRKRAVLLTDGRENLGDAVGEARLLRAEGIRVDVAAVRVRSGPDVRVDGVDVPGNLHIGEHFTLGVRVTSNVATEMAIQIFEDGQVIQSQRAAVQPGSGVLSYTLTTRTSGVHTYRAVIQPDLSTIPQNKEGSAFATVAGPPRVLVVEGSPGFGANVVASLRGAKIAADIVPAYAMPQDLGGLQRYAGVILVDADATELGPQATTTLRSYVGDLGRGLVVIGGPNSYGAGNYNSTPLEQVLPVRMDMPKRKDLPTAAVVLIVESLETDQGVDISKRAAKGVIGLLGPQDQVAVSDANAGFAVPLQHVTDRGAINGRIDAMQPADPMSYAPMLADALRVLKTAKAQTRHIILLGDGDAQDDYQALVRGIAGTGIQVSTIETNAASASEFQTMRDIARWGRGRYYPADNLTTIPQVFLKVAHTIAHSNIIEGRFFPSQLAPSQILAGIAAVPALDGYVVTTPKPLSTTVLASPKGDPILAQWQYGLGRAVAWTSDSQGRWSAGWLADPATKRIWASMIDWAVPPPQSTSLNLAVRAIGGTATIGVDTAAALRGQGLTARVVGPGGKTQDLSLQPTALRHYEAQFAAGGEGAYVVNVRATGGAGGRSQAVTGGLIVPYAPDYRDSGADDATLQAIAAAGGGTLLMRPSQAFADNAPPVDAPTPLQVPLLLLALLLLPLDVAARRLVLSREDWRAFMPALAHGRHPAVGTVAEPASAPLVGMRAHRRSRSPGPIQSAASPEPLREVATLGAGGKESSSPPAPVPPTLPQPQSQQGSGLGGVRNRVASRRLAAQGAAGASPPVPGAAPTPPSAKGQETPVVPAPPPAQGPVAPDPAAANTGSGEGSATSRLLDAKRRRRG